MVEDDRSYDVVVIGAGISGLTAAVIAKAGGLDVVVLEARDRVGGRLLSRPCDGGWLDLGATWFWQGQGRVETMLRELGLPAFDQHIAGDGLHDTDAGCARLRGNPIEGPALRYGHGAQALPIALAGRLPAGRVLLGETVRAISPAAGGVAVVNVAGERFCCRQVILAVPPSLAVASIDVADDLLGAHTRRVAEATPVWMGAIAKLVFRYDEPFWRRAGLAGAAVSTRGPLREIHDMSGPGGAPAALFGFAPMGHLGQDSGSVAERAVDQLSRIFGPAAGAPREVIVADWSAEVFTSPPGVHAMATNALFGHPVYVPGAGDLLLWASTETSREHPGHVEGAIAVGQRAANAALRTLELGRAEPTSLSSLPSA